MVIAGGIQFHASAIHKNFEALKGVLSLNRGSLEDLKQAAQKMANEAEEEDKIIVYGKSLQAHAGVESKIFCCHFRNWNQSLITKYNQCSSNKASILAIFSL
jgi:hypothetical protein